MNTIFFIFSFAIILAAINKNFILSFIIIVFLIATYSTSKIIKKIKIQNYSKKIKKIENEKDCEPFININQECWEIIELLPHIDRLTANVN